MAAKRVYGPAQLGNATATRYTVPAGIRFILRHVHVHNQTGGAVTFTMSIGADAAGTRLFDAFSLAANEVRDFYFYIAIEAAEIIPAHASAAASINLTLSGDLEAI
jgi:predicted amidohydrolase